MSDKYRFEEIKEQIKELLDEAFDLVPDHARARAESYWYAHISMALDEDHGYLGGSMCSMQDTLEEFDDVEDEEDED
jgi:glycine/D-amino acid oxidase-like deaminating enzyme